MTEEEAVRARSLIHGQVCYLQMPAVDGARAVTKHGGQITDPPSPDGPDRTLATITDPEGNLVGLASHRH